jgi:hypothetical protein
MLVRPNRPVALVMWAVLLLVGFTAYVRPHPPGPPQTDPAVTVNVPAPSPNLGAPNNYLFSAGFSDKQGANQWSYQQWNGTDYSPMKWDPAAKAWRGSCDYCVISFYIYFDEGAEHVARAPVAEVLAAAEQGNVSQWRTYFSGNWNEPGIDGQASPILSARPGLSYLTHGDAA